MKILVINAGSSSLKYQVFDMDKEGVLAKGMVERIGLNDSVFSMKYNGQEITKTQSISSHIQAIQMLLDALVGVDAPLKSMSEIGAVGHRVVHSGERFDTSVKITSTTLQAIKEISDLAPLHNPANVAGIEACMNIMPSTPMVAVFDTSFHSTMPQYAYMYAIPYELYTNYQIRKYGFHGTSHKYVSQQAIKLLRNPPNSKVIVCHLGNGASLSAVLDGKCIDTTMGLTPLEGLMMGTRSGDIDPAVIEYVMAKTGQNLATTINMLNKKSGVSGVSGVSSDFRDLQVASKQGNERAKLAIDMFCYRIKKYIGSYVAIMNGLDAIAFTAGIGENSKEIREKICSNLDCLGVVLDTNKNQHVEYGSTQDISTKESKVKLLVIPTNEELIIARETLANI